MGWLNARAPANMLFMAVTEDTSQLSMRWLKDILLENNVVMLVTAPTFHRCIPHVVPESSDARHASTADLRLVLSPYVIGAQS